MAELFDPNAPVATTPDWNAQQASLIQQKRMAEVLRKRAETNKMPEGEMVSGRFVGPSWAEMLSSSVDRARSENAEQTLGKSEADYSESTAAARKNWLNTIPKAVAARMSTGPTGGGDQLLKGSPAMEIEPEKPVTEDDVIRHQAIGSEIPGNERAAAAYGTGTLAKIKREDDQLARHETHVANLKANADKLVSELQVKREKLENDYKIAGENNETKKIIASALNAVNVQIAGIRADATKEVAAAKKDLAESKITHLPAAQTTAYLGNKNGIDSIERALQGVQNNPNAVGYKGVLPNIALARMGTEGEKATRADIANIGSLKIHDRSGATVTAAESPRLMPFIPTINDDAEAVAVKLRGLRRELEKNNLNIEEFAVENKYHRPGTTTITANEPKVVNTGTDKDGNKVELLDNGTTRRAKK